jgi:hypothetical protein
MTNHHVLPKAENAEGLFVDFDFELDAPGVVLTPARYALNPKLIYHSDPSLDFAVVGVDGDPGGKFGFIDIARTHPIIEHAHYATVIHHPGSGVKKVTLRENAIVFKDDVMLRYLANTEHGSSGAPVFNDEWQVIGVHFRGDSRDCGQSAPVCNEAHRIEPILEALRKAIPDRF